MLMPNMFKHLSHLVLAPNAPIQGEGCVAQMLFTRTGNELKGNPLR